MVAQTQVAVKMVRIGQMLLEGRVEGICEWVGYGI